MNQHLEFSDSSPGVGQADAEPAQGSTILPGATLLALGVGAAAMSLSLGLSKDGLPGPGLWPLIASLLMVVTAVLVLVGPQHRLCEPLTRPEIAQTVPAIGILAVFVALLPAVGVVTTCSLTGFAWLRFVAREGWRLSLILPPVLGFAIYLIFVVMLRVPMPVDAFLPR